MGGSSGASNRSELLDTSHLFLSPNFPNVVSCSGKSGMNFPEHGTAGWGSGKSEKVSGCSKLPPETSRAHLVPLKFPGENFPETIRNSLTSSATLSNGLQRNAAHLHSHSPMVQNSVLRPLPNKSIKFEIYLRGRTTFCVGKK